MGREMVVIKGQGILDEGITLLGEAHASQEEAAGAAAADMQRSNAVPKRVALDRAYWLAELNMGAITRVDGFDLAYRIVYAHRLSDGTLAAPNLRVRTESGRLGTVMANQFIRSDDHREPWWVGGPDGWLYVKWDDGAAKSPHRLDQIKAADLSRAEG